MENVDKYVENNERNHSSQTAIMGLFSIIDCFYWEKVTKNSFFTYFLLFLFMWIKFYPDVLQHLIICLFFVLLK
jgi:hypothetical protein